MKNKTFITQSLLPYLKTLEKVEQDYIVKFITTLESRFSTIYRFFDKDFAINDERDIFVHEAAHLAVMYHVGEDEKNNIRKYTLIQVLRKQYVPLIPTEHV